MSDFQVPAPAVDEPTALAPTFTRDATIHGVVAAQFGDLEFDVGKSVRWAQWFTDTVHITDINTGSQRYWVVNWTDSFPQATHDVSSINYFYVPAQFRQAQFQAAMAQHSMDDEDWVLFMDAHEGMSCDSRSTPDDVTHNPFRSFLFREVTRAITAGNDYASIPFYAFLRHVTTNVEYVHPGAMTVDPSDPNNANPDIGTVSQPVAVPYYVPYQGLRRLWRVGALKATSFDWTQLDQPSTPSAGAKIQIISYAYAHWNIQDIVPPNTTVPLMTLANDDGFRMRKQISRVRPVTGIPFDDAHWSPSFDPTGLVGPWGFDQPTSPDPITGTPPPPATDSSVAGLLTPLYDLTFRINLRDGLFWQGNDLGNVPLEYDNATHTWVPIVHPPDWHNTNAYVSYAP
jgi:hypothetical protein